MTGAKNTVNDAEIGEKIRLADQDYYLGQYTQGEYSFQDALNKIFGTNVAQATGPDSNGVYMISVNKKTYTFNPATKQLAEQIWTQNGTTVTNTKTGQVLEVGDTVYYDSGVQAYEGTGDNQGKWGILGAEGGNLLIMSKENVGEVALEGKQDYLTTGTTKLNNACNPFKNSAYADSVRCAKVEDINRITGFDDIPNPTENTHSYTMVNGYVKMDDNEPSTSQRTFEDINGKTLPTNSPISVTANCYNYQLTDYITSGSKSHNLLNDNYNYYWLDSRYVSAGSDYADWGFCCACFRWRVQQLLVDVCKSCWQR